MSTQPLPPFRLYEQAGIYILVLGDGLHDRAVVTSVRQQLEDLMADQQMQKLIIDCSETHAMNSTVIGMIMSVHLRLQWNDYALRLCGLTPDLQHMIKIARLDEIFNIDETCDDAIAALTA